MRTCVGMHSFTLCCPRLFITINRLLCLCLLSVVVVLVRDSRHSSYRSCSPALLAEKSSHDAVLRKLPGSPFSSECADTLGWSVFVSAPPLVAVLTLKHRFRALNLPSWAEAAYPARQAERTSNRQSEGTEHYMKLLCNTTSNNAEQLEEKLAKQRV